METFLIGIAVWTAASCIAGPIICYFATAARRQERSNIYPIPSGSILGKPQNEAG